MRGKRWMVLLVAAILAVFAGTGQAAMIYATDYSGGAGVDNPTNLLGAPTQNSSGLGGTYAGFQFWESMTVTFGQNFFDGTGADAFVWVAKNDTNKISLIMSAHLVNPISVLGINVTDIPVYPDLTGVYRLGEIGILNYSGIAFDSLNVKYLGGSTFEIDAVGVNGAPVPEPGTMMLLGSGLVGLAGWGRKKFRK